MEKTLFSDREVAEILGCGRSTVWRWAAQDVIPRPIKIGGMSRWRTSDILELTQKHETDPTD